MYQRKTSELKIGYKDILFFMLSMTLGIDFLNGLLPEFHIGIIFRVALLFLCFTILIRNIRNRIVFILFYLIIVVLVSLINNEHSVSTEISTGLKSIMFFSIYSALVVLYQKRRIDITFIDNVLKNNLYYGPGLFIVTDLLGVGNSSYLFSNSVVGSKSFFLSLNSVNVALIILYIYAVSRIFHTSNKRKWALLSLYTLIPLVMLGTKTSLAMVVVIPVWFVIINYRKKRTWLIVIIGGAAIIISLFFLRDRIYARLSGIFARQQYLFRERDLITYLFSTRNIRVSRALEYFRKTFTVFDIFPGRGYYALHHYLAGQEYSASNLTIPIEMDWTDILTSYGVTGFFYTYIPAIKVIFKAKKNRKKTDCQAYYWTAIIIILFGSLAGHVFLEAISSTFYAIAVAGLYIISQKME